MSKLNKLFILFALGLLVCSSFYFIATVKADTTITLVQGPFKVYSPDNTVRNVTLTSTPTIGNVLVCVLFAEYGVTYPSASLSQSGVNWTEITTRINPTSTLQRIQIFTGNVTSTASVNVTVNYGVNVETYCAIVAEWSGISPLADVWTTSRGQGGLGYAFINTNLNTTDYQDFSYGGWPFTGVTPTTLTANSLLIGGLANENAINITSPNNGFTMFDGKNNTLVSSNSATLGYIYKTVNATGQYNCMASIESGSGYYSGLLIALPVLSAPEPTPTPTPTPSPTPTPTATPSPTPTLTPSPTSALANKQYYFTSSTKTANNITANYLATDFTNTPTTLTYPISVSSNITYGFRVYVISPTYVSTELTGGSPDALTVLNSNASAFYSQTWTPSLSNIAVGSILKVDAYLDIDGGGWSIIQSFITDPLMSTQIQPVTWTFTSYLTYANGTNTSFIFDSSNYKCGISDITLAAAGYDDIQSYNFMGGDYLAGIFYTYGSGLGVYGNLMIYLVEIVTFCAILYLRNKSMAPVAVFVVLAMATSIPVAMLLPGITGTILAAIIIVAAGLIVYKAIRT